MNFQKSFEVATSSVDSSKRATTFLERAGYKPASDSALRFKRGSALGSFTSFSPRKWKAVATVSVLPIENNASRVSLALDVNTTGQQVTQREIEYWNSEAESFQRAVQTGDLDIRELNQGHKRLTTSGWKGLWVFVGVAIAVGVPVGVLAALINSSFSSVGVIVGVSSGIAAARKHWGY